MRRPTRIALIATGSLLGLLLLAFLGGSYYVRTDSFRSQLQAAASRGVGMQVSLEGAISVGLFPSPHLNLHDVHVHNRGVEAAVIEKVRIRFRLLYLLRKVPEIESLVLEHPRILIKKGTDGVLDLVRSTPPVHKRPHGPMEITATDGTVRYEGDTSGMWVEGEDCEAKAHDLRTEAPDGRPGLQRVSFDGDLSCKEVRTPKFTATDLKASIVAAGKGVYTLQPVSLEAFGTKATGSFHADLGGEQERYSASFSVPQLQLSRVFKELGFHQLAEGQVDAAADVATSGRTREELTKGLSGSVSLHGKGLTLEGYDLDGELKRFERSQRFDLLDVGAVALAGPLGLVATKGYDFSRIKGKGGGTSPMHVLVSDWKVDEGVATAEDVAMSTDTHRMALQGKLDLSAETFDGVVVAVVNAQGCVIAEQKLEGSFRQPKLEKPNVLKALAGPVRRLVNKGENLLTQRGCKVFYDGSVKPY